MYRSIAGKVDIGFVSFPGRWRPHGALPACLCSSLHVCQVRQRVAHCPLPVSAAVQVKSWCLCSCGHEGLVPVDIIPKFVQGCLHPSCHVSCSSLSQGADHSLWMYLWALQWSRLLLTQVWLGHCPDSAVAVGRLRSYNMMLAALAAAQVMAFSSHHWAGNHLGLPAWLVPYRSSPEPMVRELNVAVQVQPDVKTYDLVLAALAAAHHLAAAAALLRDQAASSVPATEDAYTAVMAALAEAGEWQPLLELLQVGFVLVNYCIRVRHMDCFPQHGTLGHDLLPGVHAGWSSRLQTGASINLRTPSSVSVCWQLSQPLQQCALPLGVLQMQTQFVRQQVCGVWQGCTCKRSAADAALASHVATLESPRWCRACRTWWAKAFSRALRWATW